MNSTEQVILVTGANGALGSAVVERLAREGARVVALERSAGREPSLERLDGGGVRLHAATHEASALAEAIALAQAEVGALTGAVLSAGTWRGGKKLQEPESAEDWRTTFDANLESAHTTLRAIVGGLVSRRRGSVVLVGSRSGARPYTAVGEAAYAASKAAVIALGQAVAAEVLAEGVRVNVVLPSTIDTPANRRSMPDADFSRWVSLESLSGIVSFLLSDAARDISGAALPVYGRVNV